MKCGFIYFLRIKSSLMKKMKFNKKNRIQKYEKSTTHKILENANTHNQNTIYRSINTEFSK
jgi:hypothetical protein